MDHLDEFNVTQYDVTMDGLWEGESASRGSLFNSIQ